jgi:hypothetical protein
MKNITTIILGVGLLVASIVIMALVANIFNPPTVDVFIAVEDIPPGELIEPYMVSVIPAQLDNAAMYLNTDNIEQFAAGVVLDQVYAGEMIPLSSLADPSSPVLDARISLALSDPEMVALVVPVDPTTSPQSIVVGDRVDLVLAVGSGTFLSGNFESVPAPEGANDYYYQSYAFPSEEGGEGSDPFTYEDLFLEQGAQIHIQGPTPTPVVQPITLPVAKSVVLQAEVLAVQHEIIVNTAFSPDVDSPPTRKGDITALIVAVPREMEEIVAFGVANGDLRVAVVSPLAGNEGLDQTPGMSWDDLVDFFKWEREEWLGVETRTRIEYAPGASHLYPTLTAQEKQAAAAPTLIPTPTATPTP